MNTSATAAAQKNPNWTRDEVTLVCEVLQRDGWRSINSSDPRSTELSKILRRLPIHPLAIRGTTFRNANSIARKSADLVTSRPEYAGKKTKGGKVDLEVLADFVTDPARMMKAAAAIRSATCGDDDQDGLHDLDLEFETSEGRVLERLHLRRERSPVLRATKIESVLRNGGAIACEVCGFDFGNAYGSRGDGFIEVHHRLPLHATGPTTTRLTDLALLCSNCHRIIHRGTQWLTVEQLSKLIHAQHLAHST